MTPSTPAPAPAAAEARKTGLGAHLVNIFRLVIKELRSIRADPAMLLLVAYSFSLSVYTVSTGGSTDATNLTIGIVDEDGSYLSRQIAEALVPPTFQKAVQITSRQIDPEMDQGKLLFVVEIPTSFQTDVLAGRQTSVQVNVDATAITQAGNGSSYIKQVIDKEVGDFLSGREGGNSTAINVVTRAKFNPNLTSSWFTSVMQIVNSITLLTVILTGAALIREREQGTVEHLLVMPVVPTEIMLAKILANGLFILVAALLSLRLVVGWRLGVPVVGSVPLFFAGAFLYTMVVAALGILLGTLSTSMGQFGLLAIPVLLILQLLSGSSTPMQSMPVWLQHVMNTATPTPHFVAFAQAVLFRNAGLRIVWPQLVAMLAIGGVYFAFALSRFRKVIFGS